MILGNLKRHKITQLRILQIPIAALLPLSQTPSMKKKNKNKNKKPFLHVDSSPRRDEYWYSPTNGMHACSTLKTLFCAPFSILSVP